MLSHLRKVQEVIQSSSRTLIRQCPIGLLMEKVFGSSGVPPGSTYRIAPANNRLQKNMYGGGYSEFMDYCAIDAFPNPGYGTTTGCLLGLLEGQGIKTLTLILWCRKWPMCYKIHSV
jgi:hypothetical protein